MIVFAVDSGLERTGYSVFRNGSQPEYLDSGLITTPSKYPLSRRLEMIYDALETQCKKHTPDVMVIEQLFFFKNQKTVIPVAQAQGVTQLLAAQSQIPVEFLTPLQIKQIVTGYGQSDKESVNKMIRLTLPSISLDKKIDDEIDAIACGLAYCYQNKKLL